jgi:small neutral amino acid transporter SnatA (MarC family)
MSRRLATASSAEHETTSRCGPRTTSPSTDEQRSRVTVDALTVDLAELDAAAVIEAFILLLIGVGPKIALVPFLELTTELSHPVRLRVIHKMLTTVAVVAIILLILGGLLTRLLHFSKGALSISSGTILLIIAIGMVISRDAGAAASDAPVTTEPMRLAVYPLAVPYLLNPAGIVVLITASAEGSVGLIVVVVGLLAAVLAIDVLVFRLADHVSAHLDKNRMLVTEKVFGFLLAALAVQLVLNGLAAVGAIGPVH